jgi:tyrosyl-tRNA synthetase
MTGPILEGLDAKLVDGKITGNKMSKSLDNYVGINEPPEQIFGKLMSITDDLLWRYAELLSARPLPEIHALRAAVAEGKAHPKDAKVAFAREITARFHGEAAGKKAQEDFEQRFAKKELKVDELPLHELSLGGAAGLLLAKVIAEVQFASSGGEARRLMTQGGVRIDGEKVTDPKAEVKAGEYLLQVGKLKAARLKVS